VLFLLIGGVRVLGELREIPAKPVMGAYEARYGIPELERNLSELSLEVRSLEETYRRAQEEYLRAKEEYLFKREEYRTRMEEGSLRGAAPTAASPLRAAMHCINCGQRLVETCEKCGAQRSRFANYCHNCGARVKI